MQNAIKKAKKLTVSLLLLVLSLAGCGVGTDRSMEAMNATEMNPTVLKVTTTWAGRDGGSLTYEKYKSAYSKETGVAIQDFSGGADETFKQRIAMDFEVGGESDVLFYFTGSDSDTFVKAGRVVSLDTIRKEFPDFAGNLDDDTFVKSDVDGRVYAIPIYGYWEGLYVNKKVCEAVGVPIPDADTDWSAFVDICKQIKLAGYTPIEASLAKEPHYWFELMLYNEMSPATHEQIPDTQVSDVGRAWINGLEALRNIYQEGFFCYNTLYTSAESSFQQFLDGKAAFFLDGSWKLGTILQQAENVDDFSVTYVPGKGERKATDIVGGFSSGWYITKKAWDDPDKRKAAVEFVSYMTRNEVISEFASVSLSATSLKEQTVYDDAEYCQLQKDAARMLEGKTSMVPAVQDKLSVSSRSPLFDGMPQIVNGKIPIQVAMHDFLELRAEELEAKR